MGGIYLEERRGERLEPIFWALLEDAYAEVALDRSYLVVVQGSYTGDVTASGSTHDRNGAADLRVWNLPARVRRDNCEALVVALRRRGCCAWYRDQAHGGMDPHIHVIRRHAADLSTGARSQVASYDRGKDGLASNGPDYHFRPIQHEFTEDDMALTDKDAITLWDRKVREYIDENGNGSRDVRTAVDILASTHRLAYQAANRQVSPNLSEGDIDKIVLALADSVGEAVAVRVADLLAERLRA
jgi:hypothetical protein